MTDTPEEYTVETIELTHSDILDKARYGWHTLIQARTHRKSRINKKWLKKYGLKSIPVSAIRRKKGLIWRLK